MANTQGSPEACLKAAAAEPVREPIDHPYSNHGKKRSLNHLIADDNGQRFLHPPCLAAESKESKRTGAEAAARALLARCGRKEPHNVKAADTMDSSGPPPVEGNQGYWQHTNPERRQQRERIGDRLQ